MARSAEPVAGNAAVLEAVKQTATDVHDLLASLESLAQQALDGKAAATRVPVLTWSRTLVRLEDVKARVRTLLDGVVLAGRAKQDAT
ncbi:MAG TPA: hypothetical protein VM597_29265, partial [Gemmataceae bacterium]|nr:hypothetical protein [Gemmataceae bacterium]